MEGWFTAGDEPHLIGAQVPGVQHDRVPASRRCVPESGVRLRRAHPHPAVAPGHGVVVHREPLPASSSLRRRRSFEPYALAAVELADEGIVVLGQVAKGVRAADLRVGMEMQVAIEVLSHDDDHDSLVYVWEPASWRA